MTQELTLRPAVGMGQFVGIPYVVALGVCDALPQAGIAWPHDVVDARTGDLVTAVRTQAGYDDEGMYARVSLSTSEDVRDAVCARVDAWARGSQVAPLASVLSEYANKLVQLGKSVEVTYPNGRPYERGTFVGVDMWGRATVRLPNGSDFEFPPEKYRLS